MMTRPARERVGTLHWSRLANSSSSSSERDDAMAESLIGIHVRLVLIHGKSTDYYAAASPVHQNSLPYNYIHKKQRDPYRLGSR